MAMRVPGRVRGGSRAAGLTPRDAVAHIPAPCLDGRAPDSSPLASARVSAALRGELGVLAGVDLALEQGPSPTLVGANGAGKTALGQGGVARMLRGDEGQGQYLAGGRHRQFPSDRRGRDGMMTSAHRGPRIFPRSRWTTTCPSGSPAGRKRARYTRFQRLGERRRVTAGLAGRRRSSSPCDRAPACRGRPTC